MFFGGGFPGFDGPGMQREVDNSEFYEILEVEKTASAAEIKKAYRKLAIRHHPDKGGDEAKFKKISEAYDVLGTPDKKELYDKYGKEGVEQGGGGMSSAEDVFSRFFGGGGGRQQQRGPPKCKDLVHELKVSLEDLYNGKKRKLAVARKRATYPSGMKPEDAVSTCSTCNGRGVQVKMHRLGPGMIQQFQTKCEDCDGAGKSYKHGVQIKKVKKVLEVYVEPGMRNGEKIVFSGEADELPGMIAGDVVFVLVCEEHDTFKRKGADLLMEKDISLRQALTGFKFPVTQLDGKTLLVSMTAGKVIEHQALKAVPDGGMPIYKRPFEHGRLFIFFKVHFPKSLTEKQCTLIQSALPTSKLDEVPHVDVNDENVEETDELIDMNMDDIGRVQAAHASAHAYDSDDDEGPHRGGAGGVQCQQS